MKNGKLTDEEKAFNEVTVAFNEITKNGTDWSQFDSKNAQRPIKEVNEHTMIGGKFIGNNICKSCLRKMQPIHEFVPFKKPEDIAHIVGYRCPHCEQKNRIIL